MLVIGFNDKDCPKDKQIKQECSCTSTIRDGFIENKIKEMMMT